MQAFLAKHQSKAFAALWCGLWSAALAYSMSFEAGWDVAWRLEIARRLLDGAQLYKDIVEVNPPLWFWSCMPVVHVAQTLKTDPVQTLRVAHFLMLLPSFWLLDTCCKPMVSVVSRRWIMLGGLLALTFWPASEIGQRELPILLAGTLWAALAARRAEGLDCKPWLVVGISLLSAYGFALKHYYLFVPVGIEIWLIFVLRRNWRPLRPETMLLVGLGALYAAAVLRFAPHFLTDTVALVQVSYGEVRGSNMATGRQMMMHLVMQSLVILLPAFLVIGRTGKIKLAQVFLLVVVLHLLPILIQGKGFGNHFIAAIGASLIFLSLACGSAVGPANSSKFLPVAVFVVMTFGWIIRPMSDKLGLKPTKPATQPSSMGSADVLLRAMRSQDRDTPVFIVSTNAGFSFYLPWQNKRPLFSRYYAMWMLPGFLTAELDPKKAPAAQEQWEIVRRNTISDIQCAAPTLILGDITTHGRSRGSKVETYDIEPMNLLQEDSAFRSWLDTHYTMTRLQRGVTAWNMRPENQPKSTNCTIHPISPPN